VKAIRSRFTYRYQPGFGEGNRQRSGSHDEQAQPSALPMTPDQLEDNLVTVSGTLLKVYAVDKETGQTDLRLNFSFNDRIVDILRIPTAKIAAAQKKRESAIAV
jgi:hypothetical protein